MRSSKCRSINEEHNEGKFSKNDVLMPVDMFIQNMIYDYKNKIEFTFNLIAVCKYIFHCC